MYQQIKRLRRTFPTVIPIHRIIPSYDGAHFTHTNFSGTLLEGFHVAHTAMRIGVPPVGKRVHLHLIGRKSGAFGQLKQRKQVVIRGMHPAIREQPDQMQVGIPLLHMPYGAQQHLVLEEIPIRNFFINPRNILIHHASGAEVHVPDLRVAHLSFRQTNRQTTGFERSLGILRKKAV